MKEERLTMEQIIKEAEKEVEVVCSTTGQAFIKVHDKDNIVIPIAVNSGEFEQWFRSYCYTKHDMILPASGYTQAQAHMRMRAKQAGKKVELHRRIYAKEKAVYYDLGRRDRKMLKITSEGIKKVKNSKILFLRSSIFAQQVNPQTENNTAENLKALTKKHFNLKKETDEILLIVFLISCFFGKLYPRAILEVYGQKGSAKSTCLKHIQDLVDPHTVNPLFSMPRKENEVAMCLSSEYMVCFDNISFISQATSDLLCRSCTGTAQIKRELFTDNKQFISEPDAIACLNSTRQCIVRDDLADRAIFLELERISPEKMQSVRRLQEEWENDKGLFFGALCLVVQGILGDEEPVRKKSPIRLVDFYELAVKAGKEIGYSEEQVHGAFKENKKKINNDVIQGSTLLTVLVSYMSKDENRNGIRAQVENFYKDIKLFALDEWGIDGRHLPGAPAAMTRKMGENKSNLEDMGIYFKVKPGKNAKYIEIWRQ